jgi:hypothetical protein
MNAQTIQNDLDIAHVSSDQLRSGFQISDFDFGTYKAMSLVET